MSATAFLLVLAYGFADAFAGGSLGVWAKRLDDKLPGRAAFWGALLCAGVGFLVKGPWGAAMALVWLAYRSPGWKVFGGSATPVGGKEIAGTFARHALALLALPVVFWAGEPVLPAALAFGAYALAATILAALYGRYNAELVAAGGTMADDDPFNRKVELARGVAFSLAVIASF